MRLRRLGMLVPSSNTVVEAELPALVLQGNGVSVHVARVGVVAIDDDAASNAQFQTAHLVAAARLLADANVDLILWNGTSSAWLGFERDALWTEAIEASTGIRATTAVMALNATLQARGLRRIGLVTPYVAAIEAKIIANYRSAGIEVVAAERRDLIENTAFAQIAAGEIGAMVRAVAHPAADAVVILCTNVAGATIAPGLEHELGLPVLDSVRVAVAASLERLAAPRS